MCANHFWLRGALPVHKCSWLELSRLSWSELGERGKLWQNISIPQQTTTKPTSHIISSSSDSLSFVISLHDEAAAVSLCSLFPFSLHYKIDVCRWVEHWWQCSLNFNSTRQRQFQLKLPPLPFDAPSPKQRRIIVDFIINSPHKKTLYFPTCQTLDNSKEWRKEMTVPYGNPLSLYYFRKVYPPLYPKRIPVNLIQ